MKLLSPYHRRPRNLWVSGRLTLFITILLFRSVIKCNFPSFQLGRIQFRYIIHMSRQSRPGILSIEKQACMLGSRVSDPSFVTRDMSRIRHSDTQSLSRDHRPRFRLSPMSRRHNSGPGNDIYQSWDWGSGNALQIEGTMPGLARHHYTIINLMSLCEEI